MDCSIVGLAVTSRSSRSTRAADRRLDGVRRARLLVVASRDRGLAGSGAHAARLHRSRRRPQADLHRQTGKRANDLDYLHAGMVGMSYGWWHSKHNRHHLFPHMPRTNLRHAQPWSSVLCARRCPLQPNQPSGLLPPGAKSPARHRRATAPDERTMTITETTTVAPTTRTGRVAVHTVRFSHPALDTPAFRWAAASPGSVQAPRDVPLLFLAPCGDERLA